MTTPKRTGLVCPACRQPVAIIERETDDGSRSGARRAAIDGALLI